MNHLKLLILSSAVVTLTGCSTLTQLYDAYFMAGYDNEEYSLITKIRTHSQVQLNVCDDQKKAKESFEYIYYKSVELSNFTQYIPDNQDAYNLSKDMVKLSEQAKEMYNAGKDVSPGFCKLKMQQINRSAETIQKVIGSKPR